MVFESDKFILSKSGMYVEKGYMRNGMWKLNVMTLVKSEMNALVLLLIFLSPLIYGMVD